MKKGFLLSSLALLVLTQTGCSSDAGTNLVLGPVGFSRAFDVSRETLIDYSFSISEENPPTGLLVSRPLIEREHMTLTPYMVKKVATLHLTQDGQNVVANLAISRQRLATAPQRDFAYPTDTYSGVPHQTPAQETAATTEEQNRSWQTIGPDHALESKILTDISHRLKTGPTSAP